MAHAQGCPVCSGKISFLDVVDFNKSCCELGGTFLPLLGVAIYYSRCDSCGFVFAPEFLNWTDADFRTKIYNDDYSIVDPDSTGARARANASMLESSFGQHKSKFNHLDYGGGNGALSRTLSGYEWASSSYDPFTEKQSDLDRSKKFDLITAFEVFEHANKIDLLMNQLSSLCHATSLILFSTSLTDDHIKAKERITWWYASPRNGHISLFSRESLRQLGAKHGFGFGSFTDGIHFYLKNIPEWAQHLIRP